MELVAALVACTAWGGGNFIMGVTGRSVSTRIVVFVSFFFGLVGACALALIFRPNFELESLLWGGLAGIAQGTGWLLFAFAMKTGRVSTAAPTSASVATVIPYVVGVFGGDVLTATTAVGALLALGAVILLTSPQRTGQETSIAGGVWLAAFAAIGSGLLFALQFLALRHVSSAAPISTVLGASAAVVLVVGLTFLFCPLDSAQMKKLPWPAIVAGLAILAGDFAFIYAVARGPLTSVVALTALHPAVTVSLAAFFLRERLDRTRKFGVGLALVGIVLIAVR